MGVKIMKKLLVLLLLLSSCQVSFAQDNVVNVPIEHYKYGDSLDIEKVIEVGTPPEVCAVVTTHMIYLDSKGTKHDLEYNIMGNGCSNG
jgi:hypothetical protein